MVCKALTFEILLPVSLLLAAPSVAEAQVRSRNTAHAEVRVTIVRPAVLRVSDRLTRVDVGKSVQAAVPKSTVRPCDGERAGQCQLVIFDLL